jgi:hypothetical protein
MASDSTRWPLLDSAHAAARAVGAQDETRRLWRASEDAPSATASRRRRGRRLPRSAWLLTGLAFVCGGLVSAAGFSIGWRHQAQRNTAAQSALAAATAQNHRLSASLAAARRTIEAERQKEARAIASARTASRAATSLAAEANATGDTADGVSGDASSIAVTATRITREIQTLLAYLTTTPPGQIDSGYVASQAAYLTRQLTGLQDAGAGVAKAVTGFDHAVHKLARSAAALSKR